MSIPVQADDTLHIIPSQGVVTILGDAWSLFRRNLKSSLLIVLIPTLVLGVWNVFIGLVAFQPSLTATTPAQQAQSGLIGLLGMLLGIPVFLIWVAGCCLLSRFYYSRIVPGAPLDIRNCLRYIRRVALRLTGLMAMVIPILIGLSIFGGILLVLGMFFSAMVMGGLSHSLPSAQSTTGAGVMMLLFLLVWGGVILGLIIGLVVLETYCWLFPLLALSTARNSRSVALMARLRLGLRHVFCRQFLRLTLFLLGLFVFSMAVNMTLSSPVWLWSALEMRRMNPSQLHEGALHIQLILNLAASAANLFVMPLSISAMTLFWYDCRIRMEGLDLRLQLNRLLRRQGENLLPAILPETDERALQQSAIPNQA